MYEVDVKDKNKNNMSGNPIQTARKVSGRSGNSNTLKLPVWKAQKLKSMHPLFLQKRTRKVNHKINMVRNQKGQMLIFLSAKMASFQPRYQMMVFRGNLVT